MLEFFDSTFKIFAIGFCTMQNSPNLLIQCIIVKRFVRRVVYNKWSVEKFGQEASSFSHGIFFSRKLIHPFIHHELSLGGVNSLPGSSSSNNNLLFNILSTFRCNVNLTLLRNTPKCLNKNHSWNHSRTCRWIVKNCFYLKRKRILQKEEDEEESLASDPHPDLRVVAALRNKRRRNPLLKMERELCVTGRRDRDRPWKLGPRRRCTHPTTRNLGKSLSRIWFLARSTSHRSSRSPACIYVPTYLVRPASPPPPTPPAILVIRPGIRRRKKSAGTPSRREEFPTSSSSKFRPMFLSKFHRKDWISREQATFWVEVYDRGIRLEVGLLGRAGIKELVLRFGLGNWSGLWVADSLIVLLFWRRTKRKLLNSEFFKVCFEFVIFF